MTDDIVTRLRTRGAILMDIRDTLEMLQLVNISPEETTIASKSIETINHLVAERDRLATTVEELLVSNNRWQSIAERAMEQLDIAMNLINTLQGVNNG